MIAYRASAEPIVAIDLTMPLAGLAGCRTRAFISGTRLPCHRFVSQPIPGRETNNPEANSGHSEHYAPLHWLLLRNELGRLHDGAFARRSQRCLTIVIRQGWAGCA